MLCGAGWHPARRLPIGPGERSSPTFDPGSLMSCHRSRSPANGIGSRIQFFRALASRHAKPDGAIEQAPSKPRPRRGGPTVHSHRRSRSHGSAAYVRSKSVRPVSRGKRAAAKRGRNRARSAGVVRRTRTPPRGVSGYPRRFPSCSRPGRRPRHHPGVHAGTCGRGEGARTRPSDCRIGPIDRWGGRPRPRAIPRSCLLLYGLR